MQRTPLAMALPLLAAIVVIIWGGGIGVIFIVLNETGAGVWGAIIIGMALVVGIPLLAAIHRPILDILLPPFEAVQRQMSEIADLLSPALKRPVSSNGPTHIGRFSHNRVGRRHRDHIHSVE